MKQSQLKIHFIQHVPFEGLGCIENWIKENNYLLRHTKIFDLGSFPFPQVSDFDWLIIMGGPMSVYDTKKYPWIKDELALIKTAISSNKIVLGICLGAQFIAAALGAHVYPGSQKEIGWFPVNMNPASLIFGENHGISKALTVFHWHGDTFDLPKGSIHMASSDTTPNQMFIYNNRVLGIQFHIEVTPDDVHRMADNMEEELIENTYVQRKELIIKENRYYAANNQYMYQILDYLQGP
jgi:GMP synthase (glutamine-hydrolysing)